MCLARIIGVKDPLPEFEIFIDVVHNFLFVNMFLASIIGV